MEPMGTRETILHPKAEAGVRPELAQHASPGALLHHEASFKGYYP